MCVLLITRLLRGVGRWARKPVNNTSWVAVVTPTYRPKSVRNRCLIELFCDVVCVVTLPFWHFCWCRGFCHRTGSDLLLSVYVDKQPAMSGCNMPLSVRRSTAVSWFSDQWSVLYGPIYENKNITFWSMFRFSFGMTCSTSLIDI